MAMDGDNAFQLVSALVYCCPVADGNNPALSPTLHNRKYHWGKDPTVTPKHFLVTDGRDKK